MSIDPVQNDDAIIKIRQLSDEVGMDLRGAKVRRTSSRLCLGVEHGDYNGTSLFGVGTDRFIWMACKPNGTDRIRLLSGNYSEEGVVEFQCGHAPESNSTIAKRWERFAYGVDFVLKREGVTCTRGFDGVLYGNIPGGGMSRSASLTLNLILSALDINGIVIDDSFKIVEMAQAVENDYIGSPCGQLDQIMILFAKNGQGTFYDPKHREIKHVPLGKGSVDFRFVILDTGTERPGLEKSTYRLRRAECESFVRILQQAGYPITCLADATPGIIYDDIARNFSHSHSELVARLNYICHAQARFGQMMKDWERGDIAAVGRAFRLDGLGLRDEYHISGPELEAMCDIARTVPGVLGERMLGGGDKGASGAIVRTEAVEALRAAVSAEYPRRYPVYRDKFAVHVCHPVDGIREFEGLI